MRRLGGIAAAFAVGWCTAALSAAPTDVRVAPMQSRGSQVNYPRLVAFPDAALRKRVNDLLAARETEQRQSKTACHNTFRDTHQKAGKQEYSLAIAVTYVSKRYLSMDVRQSEYCGGSDHEEDVPDPLTIDLTKGASVDWRTIFKPGAMPDPQANANVEPGLLALYRAHYGAEKKPPNCQGYVKGGIVQVKLWLDAKKGLLVYPTLPHAAEACVADIALTPGELAPLIADGNFLGDLKATLAPAAPPKGSAR